MPPASVTVYVGLGSNLDNPRRQVSVAITELAGLPQCRNVTASGLYRSVPMGPQDQADFVNAVVCLQTSLSAHDLLRQLQGLEQRHARVRERRWGPRTLDLDLLLYGDERIQSDDLTVPHPGLGERNFVLIPLYEIAPNLTLPDNRCLVDLVRCCSQDGLRRLSGAKQA